MAASKDLLLTEASYWDQNDEPRAWFRRYFDKMKKMRAAIQAANYSATMHSLTSIKKAGTGAAPALMAKMKSMKVNDFLRKKGTVREDVERCTICCWCK